MAGRRRFVKGSLRDFHCVYSGDKGGKGISYIIDSGVNRLGHFR